MKPQKGQKYTSKWPCEWSSEQALEQRFLGGDVIFELPHLQNLWFYHGFTTTFET